jgi:hypothetical protein
MRWNGKEIRSSGTHLQENVKANDPPFGNLKIHLSTIAASMLTTIF